MNWKQQAEKIESDYKTAAVKNAGAGAAGVSAGVAVAAMGPTAAMGIATTFGVASTGTAISTLSGAAATNAALAFKGNKKMLSALNMKKKEFKIDILNAVEEALLYSYK